MATDNVFVVPDEAWTAWVSVWETVHTKLLKMYGCVLW